MEKMIVESYKELFRTLMRLHNDPEIILLDGDIHRIERAKNILMNLENDEPRVTRSHENSGLNIAGVSASLLPENVSIRDLKDVRQYFRIHDKTMREHKAFATIHYLIEHIESVSNDR